MHTFLQLLKSQLLNYCQQSYFKCHFLIGLSGGKDSIALLHGLHYLQAQFEYSLSAHHVNHGLSQYADQWMQFTANFCQDLKIDYTCESITLDGTANLEAQARSARYQSFTQQRNLLAQQYPHIPVILITAHHQQDLAENYILRLMRGAGVQGLSGIVESNKEIWRPILHTAQDLITDYIQTQGLSYVQDESNSNLDFDRNFVRHKVIQLLNTRWPKAIDAIEKSHAWSKEAAFIATDLAQIDLATSEFKILPIQLSLLATDQLISMPEYRAKNLLRYWLGLHGIEQISGQWWPTIVSDFLHAAADAQPSLLVDKSQQLYLSCTAQGLYIYKHQADFCISFKQKNQLKQFGFELLTLELTNDSSCQLNQPKSAYLQIINYQLDITGFEYLQAQLGVRDETLVVRNILSGDRFKKNLKLPGCTSGQIKKVCQFLGIPFYLKKTWPVIVNQAGEVLFIPGFKAPRILNA